MEKISTLEITFQNETIYIYLNKAKIYQQRISSESITDKITKIYIGSNYGDTEMLVGNIYNLTLNANNREIISDRNLFINYPEYIKQEQIYELNLNITAIEWQRISPTKYHIRINNTATSQNGFFIVFLETYDTLWKAYITKNGRTTEIPENNHIKVFNYANAWYINQTGYLEITIEYEPPTLVQPRLRNLPNNPPSLPNHPHHHPHKTKTQTIPKKNKSFKQPYPKQDTMNKTKTLTKKNKIAITLWLGITLITTGITLWLYTDQTIKTHQQILQNPNLTQQEKWKYQGSLEWWKKAALTTYHPTATALITIGTCLTETALILLITQPKQNKQK